MQMIFVTRHEINVRRKEKYNEQKAKQSEEKLNHNNNKKFLLSEMLKVGRIMCDGKIYVALMFCLPFLCE